MDDLQKKIISSDLESALGLAKLYGNLAWNNHVNIYSAVEIEDCLFQKLQALKVLPIIIKSKTNGKILHVLSEGYTTGGHTRVVERLLTENGATPFQDVIIVGMCPSEICVKMRNSGANLSFVKLKGISAVNELSGIMAMYSSVLLHINPDDIVAALAARAAREAGTKVGLYNHADHCFTYGFSATDIVFEVSIFGRAISDKYRKKYKWSFAGIPIKAPSLLAEDATGEYFLSSGPGYKYDFRAGGVFACLLEELIPKSNRKCIIIGPGSLPSDGSEKLTEFIRDGRLLILPAVKHDVYSRYLKNCFCYIDSAPVTGGSALPEAAMLGKPCLGLINPIMGYSPVDTMRSRTINELAQKSLALTMQSTYLPDKLVYEVHAVSNVLNRIRSGLNGGQCFSIPYGIDAELMNPDLMTLKWTECGNLLVNTAGFDFLSIKGRLTFLILAKRHGLLSQVISLQNFKVFVSNFAYRKFRRHSLRRMLCDATSSTLRSASILIANLRRVCFGNKN